MASKAGAVRAGRAYVEFFIDSDKLTRGLQLARQRLMSFGMYIGKLGFKVTAAGVAMTAGIYAVAKSFASMAEEARKAGRVIDADTAAKSDALRHAMTGLEQSLKNVWLTLGEALAPALIKVFDYGARLARNTATWIQRNRQLAVVLVAAAGGVTALGTAMVAIGGIAIAASVAISGLLAGMSALGTVVSFAVTPLGLLVSGMTTATIVASRAAGGFAWLRQQIAGLFGPNGAFGEVIRALSSGALVEAVQILWKRLEQAWLVGTLAIRKITWDMYDEVQAALNGIAQALGVPVALPEANVAARATIAVDVGKRIMELQQEINRLMRGIDLGGVGNGLGVGGLSMGSVGGVSRLGGDVGTFSQFSPRMFAGGRNGIERFVPIWTSIRGELRQINNNLKGALSYQ